MKRVGESQNQNTYYILDCYEACLVMSRIKSISFLAMEKATRVKILEICLVSPPQEKTTTQTSLSLTFFELLWLRLPPVERLFFYEFPNQTISFFDTILPNLKHSLSLTLQHFLPLCCVLF